MFPETLAKWNVVLRYDAYILLPPCPGFIGCIRGMNDSGVVLGYQTSHARGVSIRGMPFELLMRKALAGSKNIEEVWRFLFRSRRNVGFVALTATEKKAEVFEFSPRKAFRRSGFGDVTALTNHFESDEMVPEQLTEFAIKGCDMYPFHLTQAYSGKRYERMLTLAEILRPQTPEELRRILADSRVSNEGTIKTAIFEPSERLVWVACGQYPSSSGTLVKASM